MLNLVDFTSYTVADKEILYVLHAVYVFMVAILMVNFLIALLSTSAGRVEEHQDLILIVQRLAVINDVERRLRRLFAWYYRRIQKFLYVQENGQIFLLVARIPVNRQPVPKAPF